MSKSKVPEIDGIVIYKVVKTDGYRTVPGFRLPVKFFCLDFFKSVILFPEKKYLTRLSGFLRLPGFELPCRFQNYGCFAGLSPQSAPALRG